MSCPSLSSAVAWALGELEATDESAFEQHFFECTECEARLVGIQRLLATLRASLPPVLTEQRRVALEARHPGIQRVSVSPGGRGQIRLSPSAPLGLWLMLADFSDVTRVDFEGTSPDGNVLFSLPDVPFDRERGQVVLPCQEHYRNLPVTAEMRVRLTATSSNGSKRSTEYLLDHLYESPAP